MWFSIHHRDRLAEWATNIAKSKDTSAKKDSEPSITASANDEERTEKGSESKTTAVDRMKGKLSVLRQRNSHSANSPSVAEQGEAGETANDPLK